MPKSSVSLATEPVMPTITGAGGVLGGFIPL